MRIINKQTYIGVDGLEIQVKTKLRQNNIESKELYSKRTGVKIGRIKAISATGFRLYINLPKMVRTDNIRPFGIIDKIHLEEVLNEITNILVEFGVNVCNAFISTVEINATAQLDSNKSVECIMNLLALMLLQERNKVFLTAHGKKNTCYKEVPLSYDILRNTYQIESLKTPRLGNKSFCWKFYNKGLEEGIQNKGLLRLEQIHNKRSLEREGLPQGLDMRTRLLANQYIVDKCFGKDYKAIDSGMESLTSNVTINLIPTGETYQQNKEDEQEIWEVENNIIIDDTSDLDDEWGEDDIYMG